MQLPDRNIPDQQGGLPQENREQLGEQRPISKDLVPEDPQLLAFLPNHTAQCVTPHPAYSDDESRQVGAPNSY